jgi:ferric-dicitrate binding protein FerR (iron transport regulator)
LSEVVAVLNRQQPRRIELGEPALAQVTLSGRFLAEDIEVFTALLESGFGIKADEQNGVLVLRRIR